MRWRVFAPSAVGVLAVAACAALAPAATADVLERTVHWIATRLGWYYLLVVAATVAFVLYIALSHHGRVRLGEDHERPRYPLYSWGAMLFAAGIGVDLLFFSVAEPIAQYVDPPAGPGSTPEAARAAVVWTIFHYGVSGWALYALIGMCLGYFSYRHKLPLTIRSALYPLIGRRVDGAAGDAVEVGAMLGTVFGVAASLGIGVVQLGYGLTVLLGLGTGLAMQAALVIVSVALATISAVSGVDKGIRRLSEINVGLAILLLLAVTIMGRTGFLLNALVMNVGQYATQFVRMSMDTFAYEGAADWMGSWTLFFWAWWIAWAPFVGLFLARISRGRTLRQFVLGTLAVPFGFIAIWISLFGNAALDSLRDGDPQHLAETYPDLPERGLYALLEAYPGASVLIVLALVVGFLLYVTSADSAALVMSSFTARIQDDASDGPRWSRVFWAVTTGALCLAMLFVGGIPTLQAATVIFGLPFSVVVVVAMTGLLRSLQTESMRERPAVGEDPRSLGQRLRYAVTYADAKAAERFLAGTALPALEETAEHLRGGGAHVEVTREGGELAPVRLQLGIDDGDFVYELRALRLPMPSYGFSMERIADDYFRIEVFVDHGSLGYDVIDYKRKQLIADALARLEEHLKYLERTHDRRASTAARLRASVGRLTSGVRGAREQG